MKIKIPNPPKCISKVVRDAWVEQTENGCRYKTRAVKSKKIYSRKREKAAGKML